MIDLNRALCPLMPAYLTVLRLSQPIRASHASGVAKAKSEPQPFNEVKDFKKFRRVRQEKKRQVKRPASSQTNQCWLLLFVATSQKQSTKAKKHNRHRLRNLVNNQGVIYLTRVPIEQVDNIIW